MSLGHIFPEFFFVLFFRFVLFCFVFFLLFNFLFPGHDFEMVAGNVLSQLAVAEKVKNDILPLRLSRFSGFKEVKSSQMMLQQHTVLEYNHGINK